MVIDNTIKIADIISLSIGFLTFVLAVIGAIVAYRQWKSSLNLKKAEFVKDALSKLRDDKDIASVLYEIDYNETEWYNEQFLNNLEIEAKFDRTFDYLNYLCYLKMKRFLGEEEFIPFEYRLQKLANNYSFRNYIFNIYNHAKKNKTPISFYYLLSYLKKQNMLDAETLNPEEYDELLNM